MGPFYIFVSSLVFFHGSEFLLSLHYHPRDTKFDGAYSRDWGRSLH